MKSDEVILRAKDVSVTFPVGGRRLIAVDGVSLEVYEGETLALVGESGSGKSTTALALIRAIPIDGGEVSFLGQNITNLREKDLFSVRRQMQMVFQDPYSSLDPRMTVRQIITEPLRAHGMQKKAEERVPELLAAVGLSPESSSRKPDQFSGGQRQRIAIARALALRPRLIIADEPVSALDVSIQAQVVNLLQDVQREFQMSYLIIAHDLGLVNHIADRVIVMYLGRIVEQGTADQITWEPQHPYTVSLLSASPGDAHLRKNRIVLGGEPPSPIDRPSGCPFHPRCPIATERCTTETPILLAIGDGRKVACHFPGAMDPPLVEIQANDR
ncbi:MAG TPA: ABC transporter ATP-binding protein [Candidatus Nanopelagicaceae bacterium]